eukprot:m.240367 g.240367  ORF g.240367 m.240367 type:complete len:1931 (+) comp15309_c2_seq1:504-6296(+)
MCNAGFEISTAGTATSDRVCTECVLGSTYLDSSSQKCEPVRVCALGSEELSPPTTSTDRICQPCVEGETFRSAQETQCTAVRDCVVDKEQVVAPTLSTDRICEACILRETYLPDGTVNGQCVPVTDCLDSEYTVALPTTSSNRVCATCEEGTYLDVQAQQCVELSTCDGLATQVEPTSTTDRVCKLGAEICDGGLFGSTACSCFADNCQACYVNSSSTPETAHLPILAAIKAPRNFAQVSDPNAGLPTCVTRDAIAIGGEGLVDACWSYCRSNLSEYFCNSYFIRDTVDEPCCTFFSAFDELLGDPGRFYVVPQCQECISGYLPRGTVCEKLSVPPTINKTVAIDLTIPSTTPVGTIVDAISVEAEQGYEIASIVLDPPSPSIAIDANGRIYVSAPITKPTTEAQIKVTDNRTECLTQVNQELIATPGGCITSLGLVLRATEFTLCDTDQFYTLSPGTATLDVVWKIPSLPEDFKHFEIQGFINGQLDETAFDATHTLAPGVYDILFQSAEALSIGGRLKCTFQVTIQYGFAVQIESTQFVATRTSTRDYALASPEIAPDATRLPSFSSKLNEQIFINLEAPPGRPLSGSILSSTNATLDITLRWCSHGRAFPGPSDPTVLAATPWFSNVTVSGEGAEALRFSPANTFVTSDEACLQIRHTTEPLSSVSFALDFIVIELSPPIERRRRELATPVLFVPSFPHFIALDYDPMSTSQLSLDDVTPPEFLYCPQGKTVAVNGSVASVWVQLEQLEARDTVSTATVYNVPNAYYRVADSPFDIVVTAIDSVGNIATCEYQLVLDLEEVAIQFDTFTHIKFHDSVTVIDNGYTNERSLTEAFYSTALKVPFSSLTFDMGAYNTMKLVMRASDGSRYFVKTIPDALFGQFNLQMLWSTDLSPIPDFSQSYVSVEVKLTGVMPETVSNLRNLPEEFHDDFLPETFRLAGQMVMDSSSNTMFIRAVGPRFRRGITFEEIIITVRYLLQSPVGAAQTYAHRQTSFTAKNKNFVGFEYVFDYVPGESMENRTDFLGIIDVTPPTITCPPDVTVTIPSTIATPRQNASWSLPSVTDNRPDSELRMWSSSQHVSGQSFDLLAFGDGHTVEYTARDLFGNTASCTFKVFVTDSTKPQVTCDDIDVVLGKAPNSAVLVGPDQRPGQLQPRHFNVTVVDNSDTSILAVPELRAPLATLSFNYSATPHSVRFAYRDSYGNIGRCTSQLRVLDNTPPVLECPSLARVFPTNLDIPYVIIGWNKPNVIDNSGTYETLININGTYMEEAKFLVGNHTVTFTATDYAGNSGSCSVTFEVTPTLTPEKAIGLIAGTGSGGLILLCLLIVAAVMIHNYRMRAKRPQNWEDIFKLMEQFKDQDGDGPRFPREIMRGHVKLLNELGKGAFGIVYKGMLTENPALPGYLVGVKSLHNKASLADRQELLEESAVMAQLVNPHIVQLIGVVTVGKPLLVLVEFMEYGDLKGYVEKHTIDEDMRVMFAGDACEGLRHVHSLGFIHRDVAARNILISSELRAKVSDFGLAREIEEDDTYYKSRGGQLPVRWTSPEALEERKFNEKTDVWSVGILFYEIWTDGALPYDGWSNQKVWVHVAAGHRLSRPEKCSEAVYDIMRKCWEEKQADRPTFAQLTKFFRERYFEITGIALDPEPQDGYLDLDPSPEPTGRFATLISSVLRGLSFKSKSKSRKGKKDKDNGVGSSAVTTTNPVFTSVLEEEQEADEDPDGLYDMGDEVKPTNDAADLYDMGDEEPPATTDNDPEDLYDMGGDMGGMGAATDVDDLAKQPEPAATYTPLTEQSTAETTYVPVERTATGGSQYGFEEPTKPTLIRLPPKKDEPVVAETAAPSGADLYALDADDEIETIKESDVGKRVIVQGYDCGGVLRFVGLHKVKQIERCGVELDEPLGKNNGTVNGHVYFQCPDNHGVLCAPGKVTLC